MVMKPVPPPGTSLPPLEKPRLTSTHILRWLAAQQNWDKIHFDQQFCRDVAKLEAPVINGALKQHLIVQFLSDALPGAWPWRVDYQFVGPDYVGEKLRVQGKVTASQALGSRTFVSVQVEIFNTDRAEVTTRGEAVVIVQDGQPVVEALEVHAPEGMGLPEDVAAPDPAMAPAINARLGTQIDARASRYAIDLSRLRLFAEAVMGLAPEHFDSEAGAASPWGAVVAPPLFPLHGLEAMPGALPLSEDIRAQGREGVNEVGRDLAQMFGFEPVGGMNAGDRVQIYSLARAGERIRADSTLVGARRRTGKRGGDMVFFETLNRYTECGGRPLVTERQTVVVRLLAGG
jgi:acyl dehydratase